MEKIKINYDVSDKIENDEIVRVKYSGHITEIMYQDKINTKATIKKIDSENYVVCATGEIKQYNHSSNRTGNLSEVRRSLQRLRDYINTNVTDTKKCRWITLTYAENMTDSVRLQKDLQRLVRKSREVYGHFEYITACEPQGRGAWHAHAIFIFKENAPYMPNEELRRLWGNGFVKVDKLKNCDNVGAYLTAYLGDIELTVDNHDILNDIDVQHCKLKKVNKKRYIKGGRMYLYPTGFNIYRVSRGIKKPDVETMKYKDAKKKVTDATMTYQKAMEITDGDFHKTIKYEYYNILRKKDNNLKSQ